MANIVLPHVGEGMDGSVLKLCNLINSPIPIVPISKINNFQFNKELLSITGDYILIDFIEYGWDWNYNITGSHIIGMNDKKFDHLFSGDWNLFFEWVSKNKPLVYFKRELLKDDVTSKIRPIEYPAWVSAFQQQSKQDFNTRPIEVFNYWGRSHEDRLRIHYEIWELAYKSGNYDICDNIYYVRDFLDKEQASHKWVTCNIPWYSRIPIENILVINSHSKISISMPGAGRKCFRHSEVPLSSVMAMANDNFAWAYEWEHNVNCIKVNPTTEIKEIVAALSNENLYDIYVKGLETAKKYQADNYIKNYIEPTIINALNDKNTNPLH